MDGLANYSSKEGAVCNVEVTESFPWRARKVTLINDSTFRDLQFKFNPTEEFGTLKPLEQLSIYHIIGSVILKSPSGSNVDYRLWGFG